MMINRGGAETRRKLSSYWLIAPSVLTLAIVLLFAVLLAVAVSGDFMWWLYSRIVYLVAASTAFNACMTLAAVICSLTESYRARYARPLWLVTVIAWPMLLIAWVAIPYVD